LEPHLETHPSLHDTLMTKLPNMMNAAEACNASLMTSKPKHHYSVTAFKVPFPTYLLLTLPSTHHLPYTQLTHMRGPPHSYFASMP
jgi:hypothetical protein